MGKWIQNQGKVKNILKVRKVIFHNLISLDGFFEGRRREIDWHNVDNDFNDYAISILNSVDTLIFGRVTYELMAGYWPTESALKTILLWQKR